jgi:gas vesicle structural protein
MVMQPAIRGTDVNRSAGPSGLADVVELILDKGLVIDAFVRVSLLGIELLTIDARIVIASVDTYLRFAEAVNRLDLNEVSGGKKLQDLGSGSSRGTSEIKGALSGAKEKASEAKEKVLQGSEDAEDETSDAEDDTSDQEAAPQSSDEEATDESSKEPAQDENSDEPAEPERNRSGIGARIKDRGKVY